jgi:Phytanoyl-CoA dioxygenase (PhyH)
MKVGVDWVHDGVLSGDIIVGPLGVDATDVLMLYNARERADVNGFGPWTRKAGILHVQPSAEVMSSLLAIRLHLDESGIDNGPLLVIAGSHRKRPLSAEQIGNWNKESAETCTVPKDSP